MLAMGAQPVWDETEQDERPGMVATFRHRQLGERLLLRHPHLDHRLPRHPDRGRGVRCFPSQCSLLTPVS